MEKIHKIIIIHAIHKVVYNHFSTIDYKQSNIYDSARDILHQLGFPLYESLIFLNRALEKLNFKEMGWKKAQAIKILTAQMEEGIIHNRWDFFKNEKI